MPHLRQLRDSLHDHFFGIWQSVRNSKCTAVERGEEISANIEYCIALSEFARCNDTLNTVNGFVFGNREHSRKITSHFAKLDKKSKCDFNTR